jgi:putative endonuclease
MYYTYIIQSQKTNKYYIGCTSDITKRLLEHNGDWTQSTRGKGPWTIVYTEKFNTKPEALIREKKIKSYHGGNEFKKLISLGCRSGQSDQTVNLTP